MAFSYPPAMRRLINELSKLPTIGEKSAARLAYRLLTQDRRETLLLGDAIRDAAELTMLCSYCHFLAEKPVCSVCEDERRMRGLLCVVEKPADVIAIERSGGYRGIYHVLHGVWSPLKGVGPEDTKLTSLIERIRNAQTSGESGSAEDPLSWPLEEVIVATGTTVEGDATALYIANSLEGLNLKITRIAQGLPKGGELEYTDDLTLHLSLEGRRSL